MRQNRARGGQSEATVASVKSLDSTDTDTDPGVASTVRLLHRRRGWIWATVIGAVAWVAIAGLMGALAPDASGAGANVAAIFVLLLTVVVIVGLIAIVVDTVQLRRRHPGIQQQARQRTAHYPVRAHAYSYPPRHRFTWIWGWFMMAVLLGLGVAALPGLVDGIAYLAGAESTSTFQPLSYSQDCGRSGCTTVTDGVLANGASVTWPDQVPLDQPFSVRVPVMDWGFGSQMVDGDGGAIGFIFVGVLFDGFAGLELFLMAKLGSRWWRHRQQNRQLTGSDWSTTS
jgi:hypothetical protein